MDFRVYVEADNFYSHEFADSDQWMSFRLTALDSEETLFGYARPDSAEARRLLRQLMRTERRQGARPDPAPGDSGRPQVPPRAW